jgi:hypothetical protein
MARNLNLSIDAGTTFTVNLPPVRDSAGTVVDITGFTIVASMKASYLTTSGIDFDCTIISGPAGTISLTLAPDVTTSLNPGTYVYDVLMTDTGSISTRIFEGRVEVTPGVTTLSPNARTAPQSRQDMILWCKRKLGYPVLEINVDQDQLEDMVDQALQMWREYHYDATIRTYLKHRITSQDINNEWIPCDDSIITVVRSLHYQESSINLFDLRYQLRLQDFYNFTNVSMVHYEITQEKLALLDWMLNPDQQIRFNRHTNRIYINLDWKNQVLVGDFIIFEVYAAIDGDEFSNVWDDRWLKAYTTALFKQQWGANMKKFIGTNLVGGVQMNGQQLFDEATRDIEKLETQLYNQYQAPMRMFLG